MQAIRKRRPAASPATLASQGGSVHSSTNEQTNTAVKQRRRKLYVSGSPHNGNPKGFVEMLEWMGQNCPVATTGSVQGWLRRNWASAPSDGTEIAGASRWATFFYDNFCRKVLSGKCPGQAILQELQQSDETYCSRYVAAFAGYRSRLNLKAVKLAMPTPKRVGSRPRDAPTSGNSRPKKRAQSRIAPNHSHEEVGLPAAVLLTKHTLLRGHGRMSE